jgi:DNA-binding MarR family transcriptional regulator
LRSFLRSSERIGRENGLTPQRHLLLLMIKGAPDGSESSTVSELVERLELAQSTVTELVGRAEEAGLIEREASRTDARVAHLRLRPEGERRLARVFQAHDGERRRLLELVHELEDGSAPGSERDSS